MRTLRTSPLLFSLFALLISTLLFTLFMPQPAQAEVTFSPTVRVITYKKLLNGGLSAQTWGSGTIISSTGEVLTNAHVVMDQELGRPFDGFIVCVSESVYQAPYCRFSASLVRYDEKIDLAILKMDNLAIWGANPPEFPYLSSLVSH